MAGLTGNSSVLGIEAENTGEGEPWPAVQREAYRQLAAALASGVGKGAEDVCAYRECAPGRKPDPRDVDMEEFRRSVAELLGAPPTPRPQPEPTGTERERIAELQQLLGLASDGGWEEIPSTRLRRP